MLSHVYLPKKWGRKLPKRILTEKEWREDLGIAQSVGWEHYAYLPSEPHILLFRRNKGKDEPTLKYPELRDRVFAEARTVVRERFDEGSSSDDY